MVEYKSIEQKRKFYTSAKWVGLRKIALMRDNHECQHCKEQGRVHVDSVKVEGERKSIELNVHHVKEIEYYPELAEDIDNLITLCLECHNKVHGKGFKPSKPKWDDERW